jgi:hypothetical protein
VGAVVGDVAIAIFVDQGTRGIVRLRTGEDYSGWILRSVKGREATLEKGRNLVLLALPAPGVNRRPKLTPYRRAILTPMARVGGASRERARPQVAP